MTFLGGTAPTVVPLDDDGLRSFAPETTNRTRVPVRRISLPLVPAVLGATMLCGAAAALAAAAYSAPSQPAAIPMARLPIPTPEVLDGSALISTRPEGAQVFVDGLARGTTPLKLRLRAGDYMLELRRDTATRALPLVLQAGASVSHYVDLPAPVTAPPMRTPSIAARRATPESPGLGWATIAAPFELEILRGGAFVGRSGSSRLVLPAGRHDLELVNAALRFRTTMSVVIVADETTLTTVTPPNGSLSINAQPWADVWIDGKATGTTPLANVAVSIGTHEILWRHPQLGERRQIVTVTEEAPVRVGISFK